MIDDADLPLLADRLEILIAQRIEVAAINLQSAAIRRALDLRSTFADTVETRASLQAKPDWILGHLHLARAWRDYRRVEDARAEYELGFRDSHLRRCPPPTLVWSNAACFIGQLMSRKYIEHERDELAPHLLEVRAKPIGVLVIRIRINEIATPTTGTHTELV